MSSERGDRRGERAYWLSVERLLDSPAIDPLAGESLEREFPAGAERPPEGVTRRSMLQLMGASFALAGLASCRRPADPIVPYVDAPEGMVPGIAERYATTMPVGTNAYGVVVESHEGRPTKIEGNELHPASLGATSVWMQGALLDLYDPDRARRVVHDGEAADLEAFAAWWTERVPNLSEDGGRGLAVIAAEHCSPTLARLESELQERFPAARVVHWSPVSDAALFEGWGGRPVYDLGRAEVVCALDDDLLLTASDSVAHARGFTNRRDPDGVADGASIARLYAVESTLSLTGANADHRLALRRAEIGAFVAALASELGVDAGELDPSGLPDPVRRRAGAVARDLERAGSAALVTAGRSQPPAVQGAVRAIDERLGAVGSTVSVESLDDVGWTRMDEIVALVDVVRAGEIGTVVVLGGDPVATFPADLELGAALELVEELIHLGTYRGATGELASWHLPEAHYLESWGDAVGPRGSTSVVQPLIEPLLNGVSAVELLALLVADEIRSGYEIVRETWDRRFTGGSARTWRRTLHDGVLSSESPSLTQSEDGVAGAVPSERPPRSAAASTAPSEERVAVAGLSDSRTERPPRSAAASDGFGRSEPVEAAGVSAGRGPRDASGPVADPEVAGGADPRALMDAQAPRRAPVGDGSATGPAAGSQDDHESAASSGGAAAGDTYELTFIVSPTLHDGRFANNAWLQELPDPITKITWGNPARVSPATADELGVVSGDHLRLTRGERTVELPVIVLPGQADGSIALELGYGDPADGRVSGGVGVDVTPLRGSTGTWFATEASVERAGGRTELVSTQTHWQMEGRDLVRAATLDEYRENPDFAQEPEADLHLGSLWDEPEYDERPQWGMAIDLNRCTGCNACVIACQSENNVPVVGPEQVRRGREMHWLRVDRYVGGSAAEPEVVFQPVPCMHCENAPCEQVCPVAATVHDEQGLNVMVYNRCIGTRYCSNNCPYKVRRFNFYNYTNELPELVQMAMNPDVTVRSRGVMEKCTYCLQRITAGRRVADREGRELRDGEVRTACQQACPADAISFGDLLDADSEVRRRKASPRDYTLLAELNNQPRTSYGARLGNPNPEWE